MSISPSASPPAAGVVGPTGAASDAAGAGREAEPIFQMLLALLLPAATPTSAPVGTENDAPADAAAALPACTPPEVDDGERAPAALAALLLPGLVTAAPPARVAWSQTSPLPVGARGGVAPVALPLSSPSGGLPSAGAADSPAGPLPAPVAASASFPPHVSAQAAAGGAAEPSPAPALPGAAAPLVSTAPIANPAEPRPADSRPEAALPLAEGLQPAASGSAAHPAGQGPVEPAAPAVRTEPASEARPASGASIALSPAVAAAPPPLSPAPAVAIPADQAADAAGAGPLPADGIREIVRQVRLIHAPGSASARLALEPEGLGEVEVAIDVSPRGATVHFTAGTEEARGAIERQLPLLRGALEGAGLTLDSITLSAAGGAGAGLGGGLAFDLGRQGLSQGQRPPLPPPLPPPSRPASPAAAAPPGAAAHRNIIGRPGGIDLRA